MSALSRFGLLLIAATCFSAHGGYLVVERSNNATHEYSVVEMVQAPAGVQPPFYLRRLATEALFPALATTVLGTYPQTFVGAWVNGVRFFSLTAAGALEMTLPVSVTSFPAEVLAPFSEGEALAFGYGRLAVLSSSGVTELPILSKLPKLYDVSLARTMKNKVVIVGTVDARAETTLAGTACDYEAHVLELDSSGNLTETVAIPLPGFIAKRARPLITLDGVFYVRSFHTGHVVAFGNYPGWTNHSTELGTRINTQSSVPLEPLNLLSGTRVPHLRYREGDGLWILPLSVGSVPWRVAEPFADAELQQVTAAASRVSSPQVMRIVSRTMVQEPLLAGTSLADALKRANAPTTSSASAQAAPTMASAAPPKATDFRAWLAAQWLARFASAIPAELPADKWALLVQDEKDAHLHTMLTQLGQDRWADYGLRKRVGTWEALAAAATVSVDKIVTGLGATAACIALIGQ